MQNLPQLPNASLILDALLLGGLDEVYLIDALSMRLIYVSENALKNTHYDRERLHEVGIDHLLGLSQQSLQSHIESHRGHSYFIEIQQNHTPLIGHIEHSQLRAMVLQSNQQEFIFQRKTIGCFLLKGFTIGCEIDDFIKRSICT